MPSLLEIQNLHVSYRSKEGVASPALSGVSLDLQRGEILGILGESGSGKSTLAVSPVRLLPPNGTIEKGAIFFEGRDLLQSKPEELRQIRGGHIALIFQEASLALHPTMRVGEQVRQVLAAHQSAGAKALRDRARDVFSTVFPTETDRIFRAYPHELSGGQRQRVLIAQAIACSPQVLIADEPTSSLDPTTQMEVLGVFRELREMLGLAMIFITHNPALLAGFADRVLVLYGGRVVEEGPVGTVLTAPLHPYTKALFQSIPRGLENGEYSHRKKMPTLSGDSSTASLLQAGCRFEPRCPEKMDICKEHEPELASIAGMHKVRCVKYPN